jgi:hypothetical protein
MKQKKVYKDIIENSIAPLLLELGYTRHKNYFYYAANDLIYSYDCYIEKISKNVIHFYILAGIDSKIFNKTIRRTNHKMPSEYDNIYSTVIFNCETTERGIEKIEQDVINTLRNIENKLNGISSVKDLVDTCINENYLVHHEDLFKYLVITKDEKKLQRYLKFVKQKLNQIAERAYASYLQKVEDLKIFYK